MKTKVLLFILLIVGVAVKAQARAQVSEVNILTWARSVN